MKSARSATSRAEAAAVTPSRASAASGSPRPSKPTTAAFDFLARLRHMDSPITPSPMNPSVVAMPITPRGSVSAFDGRGQP